MSDHMKMALTIFIVVMLFFSALAWQHGRRMIAALVIIAAAALVIFFVSKAEAHDHNRPALNDWMATLHAKNRTWCCNGNDTDAIDAWEANGDRYRVKFRGQWYDVPDGALVEGPNLAGDALLWMNKGYGGLSIRCFQPGTLM